MQSSLGAACIVCLFACSLVAADFSQHFTLDLEAAQVQPCLQAYSDLRTIKQRFLEPLQERTREARTR